GTVIPEGTSTYQQWNRDVTSGSEMVNEWHTLGFVVKQGSEQVEVDRCDSTFINLLTPHLDFQDVPQGPAGMSRKLALPIAFEVKSTGGPVVLDVQSGPAHVRLVPDPFSNPVSVGPTAGNAIATARLWIVYETGALGESITDAVTVRHAASGRTWQVTITANTVARLRAAVALALDRSGSMSGDRGDGQPKHLALREAAKIFVDVMVQDDGIGLVRYDHDAQQIQPITDLGAPGDPYDSARNDTKNRIDGPDLDPAGATSIGDGIHEARLLLDAASGYDLKSLVVMTDGVENNSRYISEVGAQIDARTYALGLGTPQNTSAAALQTLSGNHGGYLLVTGAIDAQNQFILKKYFLQILAGISNADVVLDPSGMLVPGVVQEIPFQLTEADAGIDVILLTPYPQAVDFRIRTPDGDIIEPWMSGVSPQVSYLSSQGVAYYRLVLPMELRAARPNQAGTWTALLGIGKPRTGKPQQGVQDSGIGRVAGRMQAEGLSSAPSSVPSDAYVWEGDGAHQVLGADEQQRLYASAARTGDSRRRVLPYSLLVHSYSNLSFRASLDQDGYDLGARVQLRATLAESGMPLRPGAHVWAEITRPDHSVRQLELHENEDGFAAVFSADMGGVHHCRIRASGRSRAGYAFHREQTLTAVAWRGGDRDALPPGGDGLVDWLEERDRRLCALLQCLLPKRGAITPEVAKQLQAAGFDLEAARDCLKKYCQ
ncbi:MAG TPA: vWA domain-containing protein, partial [Pseudoxanthomonas sp.]|nr:vWA domain-containing protein [Pseudoxanthomonas sp.]